jgi:hypothetical protein
VVRLRGGFAALEQDQMLVAKLSRVGMCWAVKSGSKPVVFPDPPATGALFSPHPSPPTPLEELVNGMDPLIGHALSDTRHLAYLILELAAGGRKMNRMRYEECWFSIQYRLLHQRYSVESDPVLEGVRVGILSLITMLFVKTPFAESRCDWLTTRLRRVIEAMPTHLAVLADLRLWLLLIGSMAVFVDNDPWVLEQIAASGESEWAVVRERMKAIVWMDIVHNKLGQRAFTAALSTADLTRCAAAIYELD